MAAITCESVTKTFKETPVLHDITMEVEENTIFGVLGPDGSGKTTLLRLLTGLLKPTSGSLHLFDIDVSKDTVHALQGVGCLVGEPAFYRNFTAEENLHLFADLLGADADEVVQSCGITFQSTLVNYLTYTQKKQLAIATALLGNPRLLLLDEPVSNLDAAVRSQVKNLLQSEAEKETTIFFTTSNLHDIKDLAAHALILKEGEPTACGPVKTLDLNTLEVNT